MLGLVRNRSFFVLLSARVISIVGNGFARVALAFAALSVAGAGPGSLSLILACQALPQLLLVLIGGVVADRGSRSRVMMLADLTGALAYAGLAVMVITRHAPIAGMCLMAALAGTATSLFAPAMTGVVPLIVPPDRVQQANGLLRVCSNTSLLVGLGLSGVVVTTVGGGWALLIDSASFLISAFLTKSLDLPARTGITRSKLHDLQTGWHEFSSRQWLWVVDLQYVFVNVAVNATVGVLGPLASQQYLGGARSWSLIVGAQAIGTIAGAGLAANLGVRRPILIVVAVTFVAAIPILLICFQWSIWLILAASFVAGVSADVVGVLWTTTLQKKVPEAALSRIGSYDWFSSLALAPLGLLAAGPIASVIGVKKSLLGCAALIIVPTFAALLAPEVRALELEGIESNHRK